MFVDARQQPFFTELVAREVEGLSDAITEHHQRVAILELKRFLFVRRVRKESKNETARLEAAYAIASDENRRVVTGVAVRQPPVWSEHAVHDRDEARLNGTPDQCAIDMGHEGGR